jgi:hypothetical protein
MTPGSTTAKPFPIPFAAALQAAQQGHAPILLRVETSAGHSAAGKPTAKAIAEAADRLAFLDGALGTARPDGQTNCLNGPHEGWSPPLVRGLPCCATATSAGSTPDT